jgi:putative phosphoribosyl transferase
MDMHFGVKPFGDRVEAGRLLAERLKEYRGRKDVVVLALPRGGVPVGYEVARALGAPLDILVVRKLGVPGAEELAMGAIAAGGVRVMNPKVARGIPEAIIEVVAKRETREVERREREYREGRVRKEVKGKTVIVVDDGLATGSTMRAAVEALRARKPKAVIVAAPVGAATTCQEMTKVADRVICLRPVEFLGAVGMWYVDFEQTTDEEVARLLEQAEGIGKEEAGLKI